SRAGRRAGRRRTPPARRPLVPRSGPPEWARRAPRDSRPARAALLTTRRDAVAYTPAPMTWWKYRAVTPTEGNQELSRRAIVTIVAVLVAVVAAAVTLDSMGVPFERLMTWAGAGLGGAILVVGGLSLTYLVIVDYAVLG